MMEGWLYSMNSTTQWNILWNIGLFPPQEMLPTENFFCTLPYNNATSANSDHLFGFTPCVPPLTWENNNNTLCEQAIQNDNTSCDAYEDFLASFAVEEFASFI